MLAHDMSCALNRGSDEKSLSGKREGVCQLMQRMQDLTMIVKGIGQDGEGRRIAMWIR